MSSLTKRENRLTLPRVEKLININLGIQGALEGAHKKWSSAGKATESIPLQRHFVSVRCTAPSMTDVRFDWNSNVNDRQSDDGRKECSSPSQRHISLPNAQAEMETDPFSQRPPPNAVIPMSSGKRRGPRILVKNSVKKQDGIFDMADSEGFEPSRRFPAYTLSRRAPSTTRPTVRGGLHKASTKRVQGVAGACFRPKCRGWWMLRACPLNRQG
jgi:hypothetical protein